jgi:hypothetical protein
MVNTYLPASAHLKRTFSPLSINAAMHFTHGLSVDILQFKLVETLCVPREEEVNLTKFTPGAGVGASFANALSLELE